MCCRDIDGWRQPLSSQSPVVRLSTHRSGRKGRLVPRRSVVMAAVSMVVMVMVVYLFLLNFIGLFSTSVNNFDIVVKNSCDDRNHVGFNNTRAYVFRSTHTDIDNTLERQVPFPHSHHVLTPTLFEDANKTLDAAIDS
jgi:hypothetical protein